MEGVILGVRNVVIGLLGIALVGCSSTPNTKPMTIPALETSVVPASAMSGQNYRYCYGCLSGSFLEMVILSQSPESHSTTTSATHSDFITEVQFVSLSQNLPVITTSKTSVTISSS